MGNNINLCYGRKFYMYNCIVYENITENSFCYLWGETTGNRCCNEVVSCMHDYLLKVDQRKFVISIALFCNSLISKNKNEAMFTMMYYDALRYELNFTMKIKLTFLFASRQFKCHY